jgi:hypothetical protein
MQLVPLLDDAKHEEWQAMARRHLAWSRWAARRDEWMEWHKAQPEEEKPTMGPWVGLCTG